MLYQEDKPLIFNITHSIHGHGIFTYIYHKNQPNVGKYTMTMDPMGYESTIPDQPTNQPSNQAIDLWTQSPNSGVVKGATVAGPSGLWWMEC